MSTSVLALISNGLLMLLAIVLAAIEVRVLRHEVANSDTYVRWRRIEVVLIIVMGILGIPAFAITWIDANATARDIQDARDEAKSARKDAKGAIDDATQARNESKAAKAQSDDDKQYRESLEKQLAAANRQIIRRISSLTDEKVNEFVNALRNIEVKTPVEMAVFEEPEAVEFGEAVLKMFKAAGWPIIKAQRHIIWLPTTIGVHLQVADLPGPGCCKPIVDAFSGIGIKDVQVLVPERKPDEGTFRIFIGMKPLVPLSEQPPKSEP